MTELKIGMKVRVTNLDNIRNYQFFKTPNDISIGAVGKIRSVYKNLSEEYPELSIEFIKDDCNITHSLYSENVTRTTKPITFPILFPNIPKHDEYKWYVFWITNKAHNPSFVYKILSPEWSPKSACEEWASVKGHNREYYHYGYFNITCPPISYLKENFEKLNKKIEGLEKSKLITMMFIDTVKNKEKYKEEKI